MFFIPITGADIVSSIIATSQNQKEIKLPELKFNEEENSLSSTTDNLKQMMHGWIIENKGSVDSYLIGKMMDCYFELAKIQNISQNQ